MQCKVSPDQIKKGRIGIKERGEIFMWTLQLPWSFYGFAAHMRQLLVRECAAGSSCNKDQAEGTCLRSLNNISTLTRNSKKTRLLVEKPTGIRTPSSVGIMNRTFRYLNFYNKPAACVRLNVKASLNVNASFQGHMALQELNSLHLCSSTSWSITEKKKLTYYVKKFKLSIQCCWCLETAHM